MKKQLIPQFLFFLLLLFGIGCGGTFQPANDIPNNQPYAIQFNFSPDSTSVPEYQLGYGDVLEIKFFNNTEFNETIKVRPDGRITLQRVGDIFVVGKTPSELKEIIHNEYSRILLEPEISIFVREFGGLNYYVLGHVQKPGGFLYEKNMNLLQAIAVAGGPLEGAKMSNVFLVRKGTDGQLYAWKFNLDFDDHQQILRNNINIEPQDILYIPKTTFASTTDFVRRLFEGVLPPLDLYLRVFYFYKR